jgi:hypothetical protein
MFIAFGIGAMVPEVKQALLSFTDTPASESKDMLCSATSKGLP